MNTNHQDIIAKARELAPDIEEILDVKGLSAEIDALDDAKLQNFAMRDVSFTDLVTVLGLILSLLSYLLQVRAGHSMKGATRDEIIDRMMLRIIDAKLSEKIKEQLLSKLVDKVLPDID